ncbi:MAG TPA: SH3 domain-containing protein [Clostridiales bacterium]|jgi:hypothetical protein|nr:SH3 domain-containing protein [Clostridiales bacterium]
MKKKIFVVAIMSVLLLTGCKAEETMPDFFPTEIISEVPVDEETADPSQQDSQEDKIEDGQNGDGTDTNEDKTDDTDGANTDGDGTENSNGVEDHETVDQGNESDDLPLPIRSGKTITKYVKLDKYDGKLNVRTAPSLEGEIVGYLLHTEQVKVISIEDGWAKFIKNNQYVYVSADYLVDERPNYLNPPQKTPTPDPNISSQEI